MFGGSPTRTESIRINMDLDRKLASKYAEPIVNQWPSMASAFSNVHDGDTVHFSYTFSGSYFGKLSENLDLIDRILADKDVVRTADINEMVHGKSLVVDVVAKLTRLIDRLKQENKK